jgi:hypothetical protein
MGLHRTSTGHLLIRMAYKLAVAELSLVHYEHTGNCRLEVSHALLDFSCVVT